jgi:hypothetical protein
LMLHMLNDSIAIFKEHQPWLQTKQKGNRTWRM